MVFLKFLYNRTNIIDAVKGVCLVFFYNILTLFKAILWSPVNHSEHKNCDYN